MLSLLRAFLTVSFFVCFPDSSLKSKNNYTAYTLPMKDLLVEWICCPVPKKKVPLFPALVAVNFPLVLY